MAYYGAEEDEDFEEKITIRIGICAMNKKVGTEACCFVLVLLLE